MENFKWKVNNLNLNEIRKDKSRTKKEKGKTRNYNKKD